MKEAAGEANMTVITIILIAIVLGAGTLIVTNIMNGMGSDSLTRCSQLGGTYANKTCTCPGTDETRDITGDTGTACNGESVTFGK